MARLTYRDALNEALREEMKSDPSVFVMGEDVGLYEGAYKVTKGLLKEFGPERIKDTPISEAAIVGGAIGSSIGGLRPVVELQYFDFATIAMDQICNQAAKYCYMFNGQFNLPLVISNDVKHSHAEKRFYALGKSKAGRLLFISYTIRNNLIRVISARDMNRKERKIYEEKIEKNTKI